MWMLKGARGGAPPVDQMRGLDLMALGRDGKTDVI